MDNNNSALAWLQRMLDRLPDVFNKAKDGNIGKLFYVMAEEMFALKETFRRIDDWRDVDEAQGTTLDLIGGNVDQVRGQLIDETYRILIKSKIIRNMSDGT
ncbi:MAG: hypothetical protein WCY82_11640, partial [Desulfotomaculaceae bacterium]